MSDHKCFMDYEVERYDNEKYYVLAMRELTIYGHTVDEPTRERYPEDVPHTEAGRKRGLEFGCWHSDVCPDGEIGSNPFEGLVEITREEFLEAWDAGWPEHGSITREGPVVSIGYVGEDGRLVEAWNSLEGDKEP